MSTSLLKPVTLKELYFNCPTFTRIIGNPIYLDPQKIYCQDKYNTLYFPSTLGFQSNGHFGIIFSDVTYDQVSPGTKYTHLEIIDSLKNNIGTAAVIIEWIYLQNAAVTATQEANHIDQTNLNKIAEAIGKNVLMPYINKDTGIIIDTVTDLMTYLYNTYGNISEKKLHEQCQDVETITIYILI